MEITKGMIVKWNNRWYRVTRVTKNTVNLGSIFHGTIIHKGVPTEEVFEDEAAWYKHWSQSETYMCM